MPARTLTKQEFLRLKPNGRYETYLSYLAKRRPGGMAAVKAGLNRPAPGASRAAAAPALPDAYAPLTPDQIQQQAFESVQPYNQAADAVLSALTGQAAQQASQQRAQSSALIAALRPLAAQITGVGNTTAGSVQQASDVVAGGLRQQGQQLSSDVGGKLAAIQAPAQAVTQQAGSLATQGEGAANAAAGLGSAEVAKLHGTASAAADYASKLPGIEQLKEAQSLGLIQSNLSDAIVKQIGDIQLQAAKAYQDALDTYQQSELDKAKARSEEAYRAAQIRQDNAKLKMARAKQAFDQTLARNKLSLDTTKANASIAATNARIAQGDARIQQGNVRLAQGQQRLDQQAAATAQRNAQTWARIGISNQNAQTSASRNELQWKKYKEKGTASGVSSAQVQKWNRDAGKIASRAWNGVAAVQTGADGKLVHGKTHMTYQEAMREGLAQHIPLTVMQKALNMYWSKPGMSAAWEKPHSGQGRPKVPYQIRAAKQPTASTTGGPPEAISTAYRQAPTQSGLLAVLKAAGFKGDGLRVAYGIAMRESGGRPDAYNGNVATGDNSYGLFQINMLGSLGPARLRQFGLSNANQLFDPLTNAKAAFRLSNGGRDFGAWGIGPNAYRSGAGMNTINPYTGTLD